MEPVSQFKPTSNVFCLDITLKANDVAQQRVDRAKVGEVGDDGRDDPECGLVATQ